MKETDSGKIWVCIEVRFSLSVGFNILSYLDYHFKDSVKYSMSRTVSRMLDGQ